MAPYFIEWGHAYLTHFGAWVSFILAASVHKKGIPLPKNLPKILLSTVILASIAAIFSSHAHTHYLSHFVNK